MKTATKKLIPKKRAILTFGCVSSCWQLVRETEDYFFVCEVEGERTIPETELGLPKKFYSWVQWEDLIG